MVIGRIPVDVINLGWAWVASPHGVNDAVRQVAFPIDVDLMEDIALTWIGKFPARHSMLRAPRSVDRIAQS